MSKGYRITSWNQVIDSTNTIRPIFTFTPDIDFLQYLQENQNPIAICLNGTNIYDGNHFVSCYSSKNFPNYGPNFYSITQNYVMILDDVRFTLSPNTEASFQINMMTRQPEMSCIDLENEDTEIQEKFMIPQKIGDSVQDNSTSHTFIFYILLIILVFILLSVFYFIVSK
jgi:hypothetical protein